jgi:FkbM family methyltransferase
MSRRILRLGLLASAAAQQRTTPPDLHKTSAVETPYGKFFISEHDIFIREELATGGVWEAGETANIVQLLAPGMTFLDIGAHVGYYSIIAGRIVGPLGLVLSFEPEPGNFELLVANAWQNGLTNIACFPWAVADVTGFTELHISERNTGDNRIFAGDEDWRTTTVRSVALDSLAILRPPLDVVKIDVQGAEEAVVRGMEGLLGGSPRVVLSVEFWPYGMKLFGSDPRNVLGYYRSLGFQVRVQNSDEAGTKALADDEILELCRGQRGQAFVNLLLSRS